VGTSPATVGGERSREEFKGAVKEAQIQYLLSRGRQRFEDLPDSELDTVEGQFKMRKAAAQACRTLLADARAAWAEAKAASDGLAARTAGICVLSAYRDYAHDTRAWNKAFTTHYDNTGGHRAGLLGGAHGDAAVHALMLVMKDRKAPPGFSNHSNGTAVDFGTTVNGKLLLTETIESNREAWRSTWLHAWLVNNGRRYGFHPLPSEEWHWDFR
jgi:LAS superfamily LD-carboxypeptidase LdcB